LSHFIPLLVLFYFDKLFGPKFLLLKAYHWSLFPTAINFSHLRQPPPTPASFWLPSQASIADGYRLQQEGKKKEENFKLKIPQISSFSLREC
jgi:hypothetical protein